MGALTIEEQIEIEFTHFEIIDGVLSLFNNEQMAAELYRTLDKDERSRFLLWCESVYGNFNPNLEFFQSIV
jgi:hypothetical protein